jgi:hypothetical protein
MCEVLPGIPKPLKVTLFVLLSVSSYSNLVDKGRQNIKKSLVRGGTVTSGLANKAHSVVDTVNKAIQENRIITSSVRDYIEIYSQDYVKVYAKFIGSTPTVSVSGPNQENITITCSNNILNGVVIRGRQEDTDNNTGSNSLSFIFKGMLISLYYYINNASRSFIHTTNN